MTNTKPTVPISQTDLREIIECGMKAPSGDNCQPWAFRQVGKRLELINDLDRGSHFLNVRESASWIAHGALLENMHIAARAMGYEMTWNLFPKGVDDPLVALIEFERSNKVIEPLFSFIRSRCVNRKPYQGGRLSDSVRAALIAVAQQFREGELYIVEDERRKDQLAQIASLTDRILLENRMFHDDLFRAIRWSREEAQSSRDGLYFETLELGRFGSKLFKILDSWSIVSFLDFFGLSRLVPCVTRHIYKKSSAIGFIQISYLSPEAFVLGGRFLQRLWLTAASQDLAFQPLAGVPILIYKLHHESHQGLAEGHRRLIKKAEEEIRKIVPLDNNKAMIMFFRIGYASLPSATSLRRFPPDFSIPQTL